MYENIPNKKQNNIMKKQGSILVYCVIILAMMLVIASGMSFVTINEKKDATTTEASAQAIQTADSGLQLGIKIINNNLTKELSDTNSFGSNCVNGTVTGTIGSGSTASTYNLTFQNSSGSAPCTEIGENITSIQSVGTYKNTVRSVSTKLGLCASGTTVQGKAPDTNTYCTVVGEDGRTWLDRNLGATEVATSLTDYKAYGWLYQWGRGNDGHQVVTWTNSTLGVFSINENSSTLISSCSTAENLSSPFDGGDFITPSSSPWDWCNPQNNSTLWQCNDSGGNCNATTDLNDPCPTGFHVPTTTEWNTLYSAIGLNNGSAAAFSSSLKLTEAGSATAANGNISSSGIDGIYWSSGIDPTQPTYSDSLSFDIAGGSPSNAMSRAAAFSVRCIQN
jgi:uncharacterized protein (TIGR02145 family)